MENILQQEMPTNDFEGQFNNRKILKIGERQVEYVDIQPNQQSDKTPVLLAPGWGSGLDTYKGTLEEIARDRRVFSPEHSRVSPKEKKTGDIINTKDVAFVVSPAERQKAETLLAMIESMGQEKIDLVAHSEGAINSIIAACARPEKFRNIVLVGPGGLIGKDTLPQLAKRFSKEILGKIKKLFPSLDKNKDTDTEQEEPGVNKLVLTPEEKIKISERTTASTKPLIKYVLKNPTLSLQETLAISQAETKYLLEYLRQNGVMISIIHGVNDSIFPMDKMQNEITEARKEKEETGFVDGFYSGEGDHVSIYTHPERYVALAIQALDAMEEKRKKQNEESS